jgi:hypothetical protein
LVIFVPFEDVHCWGGPAPEFVAPDAGPRSWEHPDLALAKQLPPSRIVRQERATELEANMDGQKKLDDQEPLTNALH